MDSTVQDFLDNMYVSSHSSETVKSYRNAIKKFCIFLESKHQCSLSSMVSKIQNNEKDVFKLFNEFLVYLDKLDMSPRTIRLMMAALKSYFRFVGIKIYTEDFKHSVRLPKKRNIREIPLTKELILRLLRNVSPKLQAAILVAISTGMRVGELVQFTIADIDFTSRPVRIRLPAEITKTRTAREVFLTEEASKSLKDYLKRYHNWEENQTHDLRKPVFGRTSIGSSLYKNDSELRTSSDIATKNLLGKLLEYALRKIPELDKRMENGKRVIHFHAFRKFFRTTVGNVCGRDFAEAMMGHSFYLDTYYQLTEEKKKEMFLEAEPHLTMSDFGKVEKDIKTFSAKYAQLDEKYNNLLRRFEEEKITIQDVVKRKSSNY